MISFRSVSFLMIDYLVEIICVFVLFLLVALLFQSGGSFCYHKVDNFYVNKETKDLSTFNVLVERFFL